MQDKRIDYYYLRLSVEDGDDEKGTLTESCSISSQRTCIRQYLHSEFGENGSFQELVDDGYSGTNMNRPQMQFLLQQVMDGKVRTVIVRDLSRFARDYIEAGHYLEFVFPAFDVRFISINDNFDSNKLGETTGGLNLAVKNLINQLYSKDISKKIKSAVDLKKLNGEFVYGTAPYGYKKGDEKNTIVIDEAVAPIVKRIFTMASEGITVTQIAKQLNEENITTPSAHLSSVRSKKYKIREFWTFESIRNILENRIYTGDTVPFKSHVVRIGSNRVKQIPEELRQIIPNTHEGIISRELYYRAKTVIKSNKKPRKTATRNPFTSLLVCACCGNRLHKGKAQNKNWICTTARYTTKLGCEEIRINEQKLFGVVLRAINTQCKLFDEQVKQSAISKRKNENESESLLRECNKYQRQLQNIQTGKMERYEEYIRGELKKNEFAAIKNELSSQEKTVSLALQTLQAKLSVISAEVRIKKQTINTGRQILQYHDLTELTSELTHELIKKIVVFPNDAVQIEWNFCNETEAAEGSKEIMVS